MSTKADRLKEDLDVLKGAAAVSIELATPEQRVAKFMSIVRLVPPVTLFQELLDIDSGTALLRSQDLPHNHGDWLSNVGLLGVVRVPHGIDYIEWVDNSSEGIEGFTLNLLPMTFLDYNPQAELGYRPSLVQLPIDDIRSCAPVA
jgi:hypothetical protein